MNQRGEIARHLQHENPATKTQKVAARAKVEKPPAPVVSVANAVAAGLDAASAQLFATASEVFSGNIAELRKPTIDKRERQRLMALSVSVLQVVGLGPVDKRLLNHRIRDVLKESLERQVIRGAAMPKYAIRLCAAFEQPDFVDRAVKLLMSWGVDSATVGATSACPITKRWLLDGGWRAYWFALDVVLVNGGLVSVGSYTKLPIDRALGITLGYETLDFPT